MKDIYITVTGFKHYYGTKPFKIGSLLRCKKEPCNPYDDEAICVSLPVLGTVGYVANSPGTAAGGTRSAGRIYDKVGRRFYARVMFTTFTKVICKLELGDNMQQYEDEIHAWMDEQDDWDASDDDPADKDVVKF